MSAVRAVGPEMRRRDADRAGAAKCLEGADYITVAIRWRDRNESSHLRPPHPPRPSCTTTANYPHSASLPTLFLSLHDRRMSVQNLNSFGEWADSLSIGRSEGVVMGGMSWFCGEGWMLDALLWCALLALIALRREGRRWPKGCMHAS